MALHRHPLLLFFAAKGKDTRGGVVATAALPLLFLCDGRGWAVAPPILQVPRHLGGEPVRLVGELVLPQQRPVLLPFIPAPRPPYCSDSQPSTKAIPVFLPHPPQQHRVVEGGQHGRSLCQNGCRVSQGANLPQDTSPQPPALSPQPLAPRPPESKHSVAW